MHTNHSPSQRPSGTWRCTTAVTSVVLPVCMPAGSATSLAQTLRVAHRTHCTRPALDLRLIYREQSGNLPRGVALQLAAYVAGDVVSVVADDVALCLCSAYAWLPGYIPLGIRHVCAITVHQLRKPSTSLAVAYQPACGQLPPCSQWHCAEFPTVVAQSMHIECGYAPVKLPECHLYNSAGLAVDSHT